MVTNTVMEEQDAVRRCFRDNQHNLRVQENLFGGSEIWGKIRRMVCLSWFTYAKLIELGKDSEDMSLA